MKRTLLCFLGVIALTAFSAVLIGTYRNDAVAAPVVSMAPEVAPASIPTVPIPRANTYLSRLHR
ncbi:MAG: hypothetical protein M3O74_13940 [Pseudomonadota bacterium]|nr:hypothetical protein [Pseudomonadota bacterium]